MRTQACGLILAFQAILTSEATRTRSLLQPDAASKLFHQVAGKWVERAKNALQNSRADAEELSEMRDSCTKVTAAFVAAAKGDRSRAVEYMSNVCQDADDDLCWEFGRRLADQVQGSANQEGVEKFCEAFWQGPLKEKAMGKSIKDPVESGPASPLKALTHHTQSKQPGNGYSSKDSKQEIHLEAEKIAADGVKKHSLKDSHSKLRIAQSTKQNKTVPKALNSKAEKKIVDATATALKAARSAQAGINNTANSVSRNSAVKNRKVGKKPKSLVTSGSAKGTTTTDADFERAVHATEMQALKASAAAASAAKAAAEEAATAATSNSTHLRS